MNQKTVALATLIAFVGMVAGAYALAWRSKHSKLQKGASWLLAVISAIAGFVWTAGYAIPALDDFHNLSMSFTETLVENVIAWLISFGAWVVAFRFVVIAFRKRLLKTFGSTS